MHTVLVNTTEIAAYPEIAIRNLASLKRGPKRPQMAKFTIASPIELTCGIDTALLAHQISLQSEIFALPCFKYLCRYYPREIGENGRAFYPLLACLNPCFFSFTSAFKTSLSQWWGSDTMSKITWWEDLLKLLRQIHIIHTRRSSLKNIQREMEAKTFSC